MYMTRCNVVIVAVLAVGAPVAGQGDDIKVAVGKAQQLVKERNAIGRILTTVVADEDAPATLRLEAAKQLGGLQYTPAISALISAVDVKDPSLIEATTRIDLSNPITMDLASYGSAAVPQIVDSYLGESNEIRQILLAFSLTHGDTAQVAFRYLQGIEPPKDGNIMRQQRILQLEKLLIRSME